MIGAFLGFFCESLTDDAGSVTPHPYRVDTRKSKFQRNRSIGHRSICLKKLPGGEEPMIQ